MLSSFMERCSRLASLEIRGGPSSPALPLIQEALTNATCKNLVRLCFHDWFGNDDHLIPLLAVVPENTLRDLKITNDIRHGTEVIRLLVDRQSQSLERVEILQGWSVASKDMNLALLLQTCPRLKCLQYVPHSDGPNGFQDQSFRYEDRFYGIEFQDLLSASWVCLELEELQVMITNVPRKALSREWMWTFERYAPRFSKEDWITTPSSEQESHEQQRRLFQELGKCHRLSVLSIGIPRNHSPKSGRYPFQFKALEFSMDSGLSELGQLRRLRKLDISKLHHSVGMEEVQWMAEHWPSLGRLSGLAGMKKVQPKRYMNEYEHKLKQQTLAAEAERSRSAAGVGDEGRGVLARMMTLLNDVTTFAKSTFEPEDPHLHWLCLHRPEIIID